VLIDRRTDGRSATVHRPRHKCTLAARQRSKNVHSLLVLRAVRRQRRVIYVISAIFESYLHKYVKYFVREKIAVNLRLQSSINVDYVRIAVDVE